MTIALGRLDRSSLPDTLFDDLAADERHQLVEQALARLPEHQRVPLVMFHFEEMAYEDIARALRVSLAKVKTDILRGRARLAKTLAATGGPRRT